MDFYFQYMGVFLHFFTIFAHIIYIWILRRCCKPMNPYLCFYYQEID